MALWKIYDDKSLPVGGLSNLIDQRNKLLNDIYTHYGYNNINKFIIDTAEYNSITNNIDFSLTDGSKISAPMNLQDSDYSKYNPIVDEDFSEECDEDLEVSKEYTEDILPVIVDKNYKGFVIGTGTRYLRVTIGSRIAIYAYIPTEEQRRNLKNLSKPIPIIKEILSDGKEIVIDRCKMSEIIKEEIEELLAKRGA